MLKLDIRMTIIISIVEDISKINKNILIIDFKISFYQQVTFDILDDNNIALKTEIKIHVGDVIDVFGTSDGDDGVITINGLPKLLQLLLIKIMMIIVFS